MWSFDDVDVSSRPAQSNRRSRFNTAAWAAAENQAAAVVFTAEKSPLALRRAPRSDVCKFFASGGCTKGTECPYSHDLSVAPESENAVKAGFVFVGGVANVASSRTSTPTSAGGLNPEAPEFNYGCGADEQIHDVQYQSDNAQQQQQQHPDYAYSTSGAAAVENAYYSNNAAHSFYGAAANMLGQPLADAAKYSGDAAPSYEPSGWCPVTPPSYTTRRRVTDVQLAPPPVFSLPPMDFESRHHQALRPSLDGVLAKTVQPSSRPRPPLQTLHTAQGVERFVPFAGM